MNADLQKLLCDVLVCEADALPAETTPLRELEGWDSLKHVLLVVSLENQLKAKLSADQIRAIVTISDIDSVLKQKGANV